MLRHPNLSQYPGWGIVSAEFALTHLLVGHSFVRLAWLQAVLSQRCLQSLARILQYMQIDSLQVSLTSCDGGVVSEGRDSVQRAVVHWECRCALIGLVALCARSSATKVD